MLVTKEASNPGSKQYDLAVVIGRFQLKHIGHTMLLNKAASVANNILVLVGSSFQPRTIRNPFTFRERAGLIHNHFDYLESKGSPQLQIDSYRVVPLTDNAYSDDAWINQVQAAIVSRSQELMLEAEGGQETKGWSDKVVANPKSFPARKPRVCIVGNKKDDSTYYLDLFPQYDFVPVTEFKLSLNATELRDVLFEAPESFSVLGDIITPDTAAFLAEFVKTEEYALLKKENEHIKEYKASWAVAPYPPTFVTVDAVVIKAGHILMVQRKDFPGRGLWALPGGFVDANETLLQAVLRELDEETSIDLPKGLIIGSLEKTQVFDYPGRSLRGRTFTHAHLFRLDGHDKKSGLPKVLVSNESMDVKFLPINEVLNMPELIFEDHLSIIKNLAGLES